MGNESRSGGGGGGDNWAACDTHEYNSAPNALAPISIMSYDAPGPDGGQILVTSDHGGGGIELHTHAQAEAAGVSPADAIEAHKSGEFTSMADLAIEIHAAAETPPAGATADPVKPAGTPVAIPSAHPGPKGNGDPVFSVLWHALTSKPSPAIDETTRQMMTHYVQQDKELSDTFGGLIQGGAAKWWEGHGPTYTHKNTDTESVAAVAAAETWYPPPDMTPAQLQDLYNQKVTHAQIVVRPLGSSAGGLLQSVVMHACIVVTIQEWGRYLVHKGSGYGKASETIVTDIRTMKQGDNRNLSGQCTVSDYLKAGGGKYNWLTDNCLHGTRRMYNLE